MTASPPDDTELNREWESIWNEETLGNPRGVAIYRFTFRAHLCAAERDLEQRNELDLFRLTQRLPDYPRAEAAIERGWEMWLKQECRIGPSEALDDLTLHQFLLLYGLRLDQSKEARQERISQCSNLLEDSKARGDKEFFRKLRHAKAEKPRQQNYRGFIHVLLANWLTAFWWLMPLLDVADDMLHSEGIRDDKAKLESYYQHLRQITTRRKQPVPGAGLSAGWNEVFYRSVPPLSWWTRRGLESAIRHRLLQ
jgi:hypothetical protein